MFTLIKWKNWNQYLYEHNFIGFNQSLEQSFNNGDLEAEKRLEHYDHQEKYSK